MQVIYNQQLIDLDKVNISVMDRGFQYGDGLFETVILKGGQIRFLDYHVERLTLGMEALNITFPSYLIEAWLEKQIFHLISVNESKYTRIKIIAWRQMGGLYTPETTDANLVIIPYPGGEPVHRFKATAAFSQKVKVHPSPTSRFKTMNSLPYILAGLERKERKLDELIIMDHQQHVSESTTSNIFWVSNGMMYTPSLDCGCIMGIRRRHIMASAKANGKKVMEVKASADTLLDAEQLFTSNVTGISWIKKLNDKVFDLNPIEQIEKDYGLS